MPARQSRIAARSLFGSRVIGSLPALLLLSAFVLLNTSCGRKSASFLWTSAEGKSLAFRQHGDFLEGGEGSFGPGREKNLYVLEREASIPPGYMLAVALDVRSPGLAVRLAPGAERREPRSQVNLRLSAGRAIVYLGLSAPLLRSFSFAASPSGETSSEADSLEPWVKIESLRILPGFHGLDRGKDGILRISDDFAALGRDAAYESWKIGMPAGGWRGSQAGEPALRLAWTTRSKEEFRIASGSGEELRLKALGSNRRALIPLAALGPESGWADLRIRAPLGVGAYSAWVETRLRDSGEGVDPGTLLHLPDPKDGEDYICETWDLLPNVLLFDFRDYATQDRYLKRIAFFVEKKGYVGSLASDEEIAPLHGWNAHDYRAEDLAAFFSAAEKKSFPLNREERRLEALLVERGILVKQGSGYRGSPAALISITRESPAYLRRTFLVHESTHAIFFADPEYRDFCLSLWKNMTDKESWFWRLYFGWMNYNTGSAELMANELQAYLMQQPLRALPAYVSKTLPERLLENHPELESPLAAYFAEYSDDIAAKAGVLDSWLRKNYGFGAGETYFLK